MAKCPVCKGKLACRGLKEGEFFECPNCGAELEVMRRRFRFFFTIEEAPDMVVERGD